MAKLIRKPCELFLANGFRYSPSLQKLLGRKVLRNSGKTLYSHNKQLVEKDIKTVI